MFYYLSFLRPPPLESSTSSTITIAPQICNDLRTEYYEDQIDIFYSWTSRDLFPSQFSRVANVTSGKRAGQLSTTPFAKLTTWYGETSAYKAINVPAPPHVRDGDQWALILSCSSTRLHSPIQDRPMTDSTNGTWIDFSTELSGTPFPVISLPIKFISSSSVGSKSRTKSSGTGTGTSRSIPKQEQIQRRYRIAALLPPPVESTVKEDADGGGVSQGGSTSDRIVAPEFGLGGSMISGPKATFGPNCSETLLTITEQTSFDLDKKIWDSGIGLSSWLCEVAVTRSKSLSSSFREDTGPEAEHGAILKNLSDALFSPGPRRIIELGAGTGIVSLALATLRSSIEAWANDESNTSSRDQSEMSKLITTDLPSAMPLLQSNISSNQHFFHRDFVPHPEVLDWDVEELPESVLGCEDGFHAIVMADVTYNTSSFPSLIRTLQSLIMFNTKNRDCPSRAPIILMGYKERDPGERTLWDMATEIGIRFVRLGGRPGAGGMEVEIWAGIVEV